MPRLAFCYVLYTKYQYLSMCWACLDPAVGFEEKQLIKTTEKETNTLEPFRHIHYLIWPIWQFTKDLSVLRIGYFAKLPGTTHVLIALRLVKMWSFGEQIGTSTQMIPSLLAQICLEYFQTRNPKAQVAKPGLLKRTLFAVMSATCQPPGLKKESRIGS